MLNLYLVSLLLFLSHTNYVICSTANWANTVEFDSDKIYYPLNAEEVQKIVKNHAHIKALGALHSWSPIAAMNSNLEDIAYISTEFMDQVVELDRESQTVTVGSGILYSKLAEYLDKNGFALPNLHSFTDTTVGGTIATGSHGSGDELGILSTHVVGMEMITGLGEIIFLNKENDPELFNGALVHLGGIGIITQIKLKIIPSYNLKSTLYDHVDMSKTKGEFDRIMSGGYSVTMLTNWSKNKVGKIIVRKWANSTTNTGIGKWHEKLVEESPLTVGNNYEAEYFIDRKYAYDAMATFESLHDKFWDDLFLSKIRTISSDEIWMSPCYKRNCVSISFEFGCSLEKALGKIPMIEGVLDRFEARPHWGKLFTMDPERVKSLYPKRAEFEQLMKIFDPTGKFKNDFLNKYVH